MKNESESLKKQGNVYRITSIYKFIYWFNQQYMSQLAQLVEHLTRDLLGPG